jgi:hypothetical protein
MRFLDTSTRLGQLLVDWAHVSLYPPGRGARARYRESQGLHSHSGGDVPDWDNTESRERDEDAAWRDLVARFDVPPITQQPVPWPEREDVLPPRLAETKEPGIAEAEGLPGINGPTAISGVPSPEGLPGAAGVEGTQETRGVEGTRGARGVKGIRGFDDEGIRGTLDPGGSREPDVIEAARRRRRTSARSIRPRQAPVDPTPAADEDHYIPPAPPPLPTLDSIAKGAWAALFGGPAYLVVATAAHWALSGFAVFCAVAAFVTGFAILVLRMNEPGPGGPDDGDDGAVV